MDVNVCIERATLRQAFKAAAENMPHEAAAEHVAEAHGVPVEAVHETLAAEAA